MNAYTLGWKRFGKYCRIGNLAAQSWDFYIVEKPIALDGQILFDRTLAKQGLFPAVDDPLASGSRLLKSGMAGEEHVRVAHHVRQIL